MGLVIAGYMISGAKYLSNVSQLSHALGACTGSMVSRPLSGSINLCQSIKITTQFNIIMLLVLYEPH